MAVAVLNETRPRDCDSSQVRSTTGETPKLAAGINIEVDRDRGRSIVLRASSS